MKKVKVIGATFAMAIAMHSADAQAVRDRNVIPVAVNLNEVLRMTITNGGNIEFTFNSIDDYDQGMGANSAAAGAGSTPLAAVPFYRTDFTVASSSRWELTYGAEEATFIGTDNPANTLALDNVGYSLIENGNHAAGTELLSVPTNDFTAADIAGLEQYPVVLITDGAAATANAGDATDNDFTMFWQCGTTGGGAAPTGMNATSILDQAVSPERDRYVVNVIFELSSL